MDRTAARAHLRTIRREFARKCSVFPILPPLAAHVDRARCVGLYRAMGSEADIRHIAERCRDRGIRTALPRLSARDAEMTFARWSAGDPLVDSGLGFEQPVRSAAFETPDLILTPMLGFDRAMNRLGQGAGHYDRYYFNNIKSLRVGIAWSIQEIPAVPPEPWDVPMDAICTEMEWICPANSRMRPQ